LPPQLDLFLRFVGAPFSISFLSLLPSADMYSNDGLFRGFVDLGSSLLGKRAAEQQGGLLTGKDPTFVIVLVLS